MSYDFYNRKEVKKTRKDHKCDHCSDIITKGSKMYLHAGVWEGDFWSDKACEICIEYIDIYLNGEELGDFSNEHHYKAFKEGWKSALKLQGV